MNQADLHIHQLRLLKKLTLTYTGLNFNKLLIEDISSDHTNYHLKELVKRNLVEKDDNYYRLTDLGKEYSGRLDDEIKLLEKQAKTSVIIWAMRKGKDGTIEYLVNKRLRHPYFGKVGRLTGKVRYGERLEDAAKRELFEEAGLESSFVKLDKIYHKVRKRPDGSIVQDNLFYIFFMAKITGKTKSRNYFQENFWITIDDVVNKKYDFYDDFVIDDRGIPNEKIEFEESIALAEGY
ncbi:MAG: NUDIX domain-containing protein [Patescibacteria group bacterium]